MNKIIINLSPYKTETSSKIQKLKEYFPYAFLVGILGIGLNIILAVIIMILANVNNNIDGKCNILKKDVENVNNLKNEVNSLKKDADRYLEKGSVRMKISRTMAELFASLPVNIWFDTIRINEQEINLMGNVVEWQENIANSISEFMKRLQAQTYSSQLYPFTNLKDQKNKNIGGREIVNFEVECKKIS